MDGGMIGLGYRKTYKTPQLIAILRAMELQFSSSNYENAEGMTPINIVLNQLIYD